MSIPEGYHMDENGLVVKDSIVVARFKKRVDAVEVNRPASLDTPPLTDKEEADALDREHDLNEKRLRNKTDEIELAGASKGIIPESIKAHWKMIAGLAALMGILVKLAGCF